MSLSQRRAAGFLEHVAVTYQRELKAHGQRTDLVRVMLGGIWIDNVKYSPAKVMEMTTELRRRRGASGRRTLCI